MLCRFIVNIREYTVLMMMSYIQSEYQKQEVHKLSEKMMKIEERVRSVKFDSPIS